MYFIPSDLGLFNNYVKQKGGFFFGVTSALWQRRIAVGYTIEGS